MRAKPLEQQGLAIFVGADERRIASATGRRQHAGFAALGISARNLDLEHRFATVVVHGFGHEGFAAGARRLAHDDAPSLFDVGDLGGQRPQPGASWRPERGGRTANLVRYGQRSASQRLWSGRAIAAGHRRSNRLAAQYFQPPSTVHRQPCRRRAWAIMALKKPCASTSTSRPPAANSVRRAAAASARASAWRRDSCPWCGLAAARRPGGLHRSEPSRGDDHAGVSGRRRQRLGRDLLRPGAAGLIGRPPLGVVPRGQQGGAGKRGPSMAGEDDRPGLSARRPRVHHRAQGSASASAWAAAERPSASRS